jgi:membrane-bound lytic murein transglycosylase D
VNPYAESFMQDYLKAHGKSLIKMKGWAQPYFNLIENVLVQYGLPRELKYVAVIESNLKTGAVSNKGAGGPWQLMPGTARDLGLTVNSFVDDRTDYYKSTYAASRYLLTLYRQLHDWLLVFAAYNGGPGRVFNAIKRSGSRNFWNLQYYLPQESREYVKKFIATHYIMEGSGGITTEGSVITTEGGNTGPYVDQYALNKPKLTAEEAVNTEVLAISGKFNSLVIAKNLSFEISQFNRYNPNFDAMLGSTGNYDLRLPSDKMQLFVANKYQILNECVQVLLGDETIVMPASKSPANKKNNSNKKKS